MSTRGIALGRIIDWFKNADMEELHYALTRGREIEAGREARVEQADAHGKTRRTRRAAKTQPPSDAGAPKQPGDDFRLSQATSV